MNGLITEDYGWEVSIFRKIRDWNDGLTFFECVLNWDKYEDDHTPRFNFHVMVLNWMVVEIQIYYIHHRYEDNLGI